jgi:hypothetical protein
METEWFIGTIRDDPPGERGERHSTFDLAVQITEEEYLALSDAERVIREALRGVLFRLVFANHRALKEQEARILELLTHRDRRGFDWLPDQHLQTTLALANWLTSVRWLLDHTKSRLAHEPDQLRHFEDAARREFDEHFAYRFMYNLRDYATHCDFPPVSIGVGSRLVRSTERVDNLSIRLDPGHLLKSPFDWKSLVAADLKTRSEPIDLVPLVDEAMACIERVVVAIVAVDDRDRREAAQLIMDAVERLPEDALENRAVPILFAAEVEGENTKSVSPIPLPIIEAREMLGLEQSVEAIET